MIKSLKLWWKRSTMSSVERYLSESVDMVDLERRQKRLQHKGFKVLY
jgi:hypothetical protein